MIQQVVLALKQWCRTTSGQTAGVWAQIQAAAPKCAGRHRMRHCHVLPGKNNNAGCTYEWPWRCVEIVHFDHFWPGSVSFQHSVQGNGKGVHRGAPVVRGGSVRLFGLPAKLASFPRRAPSLSQRTTDGPTVGIKTWISAEVDKESNWQRLLPGMTFDFENENAPFWKLAFTAMSTVFQVVKGFLFWWSQWYVMIVIFKYGITKCVTCTTFPNDQSTMSWNHERVKKSTQNVRLANGFTCEMLQSVRAGVFRSHSAVNGSIVTSVTFRGNKEAYPQVFKRTIKILLPFPATSTQTTDSNRPDTEADMGVQLSTSKPDLE